MYNYGHMRYKGDGFDMNKTEAIHYYKKSADLGDREAMNSYAVMQYYGNRIELIITFFCIMCIIGKR